MTTKYHITICSCWLSMLLATLNTMSQCFVEGSHPFDRSKFGPAPKGTVRTIEVPEDGDIIDCVDIYKQPAFNNPRIKDLKMAPSKSYLSLFNRTKHHQPNLIQNWRKYGHCSKGTVPIRRAWNNKGIIHRKTTNVLAREYAIGREEGSTYHGAGATLNVWNPRIRERDEFSLTQIWVASGNQPRINTIEAGWIVYPDHYHDSRTRLFSYWTRDQYNETGCYDVECDGFMQTDFEWVLGGALNVSIFQGRQANLRIIYARDPPTGDWWLDVEGTRIGYFPGTIFTTLRNGANKLDFGGEIVNQKPNNRHTGTHMGSGRFAEEGIGRASYVKNIEIKNNRYQVVKARLGAKITRSECYDLEFGEDETDWGEHFFYGGPGFSRDCYVG